MKDLRCISFLALLIELGRFLLSGNISKIVSGYPCSFSTDIVIVFKNAFYLGVPAARGRDWDFH